MAKRVTEIGSVTRDSKGKVKVSTVTYNPNKRGVKTTEFPLTPAPKTAWQKFKRSAWG